MAIDGIAYAFTWTNIQNSPAAGGVYELLDGNRTIYIGRAKGSTTTIRSRLADHKWGREGPCTQNATAYKREVCHDPVAREAELLRRYFATHGQLPRCNDRLE